MNPKFYRFCTAEGRGYPKIEWMQTYQLAGGSERFWDKLKSAASKGVGLKLEVENFPMPIVDLEDKGSKWPDVIGTSHLDEHPFIFSERAIDSMRAKNITGFTVQPIEFRKIRSKKLNSSQVPNYYCIHITGRVRIVKKYYLTEDPNYALSGKENPGYEYHGETEDYERHPVYSKYNPNLKARFSPLENTWDECDWFFMKNHKHFRYYCCSERLMNLAFEEKWTNCCFEAMDSVIGNRPYIRALASKGNIPKEWYNKHHPQE